ncbi:MAG TPA: hypothetical protein VEG64_04030 [Candidatus Sulfotelmatobacter sp.]|nr:hypothetical protein [Candidatus Sulfotelmatobacter sp.]
MKIGAKLRNPSFPEEVLRAESDGATDLAEEAVRHLKKTTQTLLVDHMDEYKPIPSALLDKFIGHLARIFRAASEAGIPWSTLSAAGSFLGPENLVLWDFYAPGSYDTTQLARMKTAS